MMHLSRVLCFALVLMGTQAALAGVRALSSFERWVHHDFTQNEGARAQHCAAQPSGPPVAYALLAAGHLYKRLGQGFPGPPNDVALLNNALRARGVDEKQIDTLLHGQATRANLMQKLTALVAKVQCHDSVVIYLTGHGVTPEVIGEPAVTGRGALVFLALEGIALQDFNAAPPWDAISNTEIESAMFALRSKGAHVLLITEFEGSQSIQASGLHGWQCCGGGERHIPPQGSLALFQAPKGSPEIQLPKGANDRKPYGTFSFVVGLALAQSQLHSYRDIARHAEEQWRKLDLKLDDTPRFYASDPDETLFRSRKVAPARALAAVSIALASEADSAATRGARAGAQGQRIAGRIQPSDGLLAVMAAGVPAQFTPDGQFTVELPLKRGDNPVQLVAVFRDRPMYSEQKLVRSEQGQFEVTGPKRVYALLIGNQHYGPESGFASLATPLADIESLRRILTTRYDMSTEIEVSPGVKKSLVLKDASRSDIYQAMGVIARTAQPDDAVLIYYAGHGSRASLPDGGKIANWVPVNARKESEGEDLVSAADLNNLIRKMRARHVLLVADSCYSGVLAETRGETVSSLQTQQQDRYLSEMSRLKSRYLLSSGGDEPVSDVGGQGLSVFARALVSALESPPAAVFTAEQLFHQKLKQAVAGRSQQIPQFQVIRDSGHDNGNFVFFSR